MNENLDLLEVLKDCPVGTELYCSILGPCELIRVGKPNETNPIFVYSSSIDERGYYSLTRDGRFHAGGGECILFPSETQRDWSKFGKEPSEEQPVVEEKLTAKDRPIKCDDGKTRWDLVPLPVIDEVAKVYTFGARKYPEGSWKELPDGLRRYKAALLRHLVEFDRGNNLDPESKLPHLAHAAWNAIAMLHFFMEGHKP